MVAIATILWHIVIALEKRHHFTAQVIAAARATGWPFCIGASKGAGEFWAVCADIHGPSNRLVVHRSNIANGAACALPSP
jgi:hypothetical protein